jgi:predicted ATPase
MNAPTVRTLSPLTARQSATAQPRLAVLLSAIVALLALITSRARLRLSAEHEYPIAPLPMPDTQASVPELQAVASVQLFCSRAQALKPDFRLSDANAAAIAAICIRLEGLPLALELAAARIKLLPPATMLARLDKRLPLLTGGPQDVPARHQSLQDSIAWSYTLLEDGEQRLFRRLAVCPASSATTCLRLRTIRLPR